MDLDESKKYYKKISEMGKYLEDQDMPPCLSSSYGNLH